MTHGMMNTCLKSRPWEYLTEKMPQVWSLNRLFFRMGPDGFTADEHANGQLILNLMSEQYGQSEGSLLPCSVVDC